VLSESLSISRYRVILATSLLRLKTFFRKFCFSFFVVKFSIKKRFLNKFVEKFDDNVVNRNLPGKGLNVPLDVIWNTSSVVHYSSAFNSEGIDKATSIICEINQAAIVVLDHLDTST